MIVKFEPRVSKLYLLKKSLTRKKMDPCFSRFILALGKIVRHLVSIHCEFKHRISKFSLVSNQNLINIKIKKQSTNASVPFKDVWYKCECFAFDPFIIVNRLISESIKETGVTFLESEYKPKTTFENCKANEKEHFPVFLSWKPVPFYKVPHTKIGFEKNQRHLLTSILTN